MLSFDYYRKRLKRYLFLSHKLVPLKEYAEVQVQMRKVDFEQQAKCSRGSDVAEICNKDIMQ